MTDAQKRRKREEEEERERERRENDRNRSAIVSLYQTGAGSGALRGDIVRAYQLGKRRL
jgi:hypothetical protein